MFLAQAYGFLQRTSLHPCEARDNSNMYQRMALQALLWTKALKPYERPPPLHVCFVKIVNQPKVVSWDFSDSTARPALTKQNKQAVITDGQFVTKVTVYEELAAKITEGRSYFIKGHTLRGQSPPFAINFDNHCQFFRGPDITVEKALQDEADALLNPPSLSTSLELCKKQKALMTVQGEVVEGSTTIDVSLWREAALQKISIGDVISISHVKVKTSLYGTQLNSTAYTKFDELKQDMVDATVVGVCEGENDSQTCNSVQLLLESGEVLYAPAGLWQPFETQLRQGKIRVNLRVSGKNVTCLEPATTTDREV